MFLVFTASCAECPYYAVLYLQVSLLLNALCAECPYYLVLYMQSVLRMCCFISKVFLLCSALYANAGPRVSDMFERCA